MKRLVYLVALLATGSCGESFLEVRPKKNQQVPNTVEHYLALLDRNSFMNRISCHYLGVLGGDELSVKEAQYAALPSGPSYNYQKNAYTWQQNIYEGNEPEVIDWSRGYSRILLTNIVLDGLANLSITADQRTTWNMARGGALFHRALNLYNLAQLHCKVYTKQTAFTDLGLPLRARADITEHTDRATLAETYQYIVQDLEQAEALLTDFEITNLRPSKWAVYALLSRIYLQMDNYQLAREYALKCIQLGGQLLDFNTIDPSVYDPFPIYGEGNEEVIFMTTLGYSTGFTLTTPNYYNAHEELVSSYEENDLRKLAFFKEDSDGRVLFTGSYYGVEGYYFTGLALDEVYLNLAESHARLGDVSDALHVLNTLRAKRYRKNSGFKLESIDAEQVLDWVLMERRKELVMRGTRWEDLRRLNKEPRFRKTLSRNIGEQRYELPPDDPRWVWPLPVEAVLYGGYTQNSR